MPIAHVNKESAAQRQLDAAIRILFSGEDSLAVHTIAAAGHGLVADLAKHRGAPIADQLYEDTVKEVYRGLLGRSPTDKEVERNSPKLKIQLRKWGNRPANFLKHAKEIIYVLDPAKQLG